MSKESQSASNTSAAVYLSLAAVFLVTSLYAIEFAQSGLGGPESWAQFGDYFGGILNPVVALAALFLLVENLKISRKELGNSVSELAKSAEALQLQSADIEQRVAREDLNRAIDLLHKDILDTFSLRDRKRLTEQHVVWLSAEEARNRQQYEYPISLIQSRLTRNVAKLADLMAAYESHSDMQYLTGYIRRSLFDDLKTAAENGWITEESIQPFA